MSKHRQRQTKNFIANNSLYYHPPIYKHVVLKRSTYIFNKIGIQPEKLFFATEINQSNLEIFTQFIKRKI